MAKKSRCRWTETERIIHERAVKIRKMTDKQLVEFVDRNFTAGVDTGRIGIEMTAQETAEKILAAIAGIKGIGEATNGKIQEAVQTVLREIEGVQK